MRAISLGTSWTQINQRNQCAVSPTRTNPSKETRRCARMESNGDDLSQLDREAAQRGIPMSAIVPGRLYQFNKAMARVDEQRDGKVYWHEEGKHRTSRVVEFWFFAKHATPINREPAPSTSPKDTGP